METEYHANIVKVDAPRRMFFGWSYIAKKAGDQIVDHSGDVIDTPEAVSALEDAFYEYALKSRSGDDGHKSFGVAELVEQVVFTEEKIEKMGLDPATTPVGVWSGYYAPPTPDGDRLLAAVQSGEHRSLSVVGRGRREAI